MQEEGSPFGLEPALRRAGGDTRRVCRIRRNTEQGDAIVSLIEILLLCFAGTVGCFAALFSWWWGESPERWNRVGVGVCAALLLVWIPVLYFLFDLPHDRGGWAMWLFVFFSAYAAVMAVGAGLGTAAALKLAHSYAWHGPWRRVGAAVGGAYLGAAAGLCLLLAFAYRRAVRACESWARPVWVA